jgi:hypothetical protein
LIVVGSIVGGVLLFGLLANIGSAGDNAEPTASTVTKTVMVTARPSISTVTVVAAPPAPRPAPTSYPPIEAPPNLPPVGLLMPPIASNVYYANCAAVRAAGAAPLHVGNPGYRRDLDENGDGVACE